MRPDTLGLPIAPGTPFRYRTITADTMPRSDQTVPWLVCVLDHSSGPFIEARTHISSRAAVFVGEPSGYGYGSPTYLGTVLARALHEDTAGLPVHRRWHDATGAACSVPDCGHGLPMYDSAQLAQRRGGEPECLAHRVRSIEACVECGAPDLARVIDKARLLETGRCFSCDLWLGRVQEMATDTTRVLTPEWRYYSIGEATNAPKDCKGFGGHPWVVTFTDGRVVFTDNLWLGGEVPEALRDRFTPNAIVESASSKPKGYTGSGR